MMIDPWTLIIAGLIVLPIIGLVLLVADIVDAYGDMIFISEFHPDDSVEFEQTKHNIWSQTARALTLILIAVMAILELVDVLTTNGLVIIIYLIAITKVLDAWRSRRSRKRMIRFAKIANGQ